MRRGHRLQRCQDAELFGGVAGAIALETTAEELASDEDAQRRYLSVEPLTAHA